MPVALARFPAAARLVAALALGASLLSVLLAVTLGAAGARADGDPASDVLLGENVFFPYTPATSPAIQRTLNAETAAASQAKFPIKVALIASPVDLGVIPELFGKPQTYADFLDQEISFQTKQLLLVVMSDGYGVQGIEGPAKVAVTSLRKPSGATSNDLAQAAITAVAKLAAASGHPLKGTPASSSASGGTSTTPIVIALAVAAVLTAAALVAVRRRQAPT